jgi:hypothetical protein
MGIPVNGKVIKRDVCFNVDFYFIHQLSTPIQKNVLSFLGFPAFLTWVKLLFFLFLSEIC